MGRNIKHLYVYVWKFLIFWLILPNLFVIWYAQTAPWNWLTTLPSNLAVPVNPSATTPTSLKLPVDDCMTKSQTDGQNAQAGYTECIKKNTIKDCQKQLDSQNKMILATYQSCVANKNTPNIETTTPEWDETVMGITMWPNCLKNGQCSFKIYDLLWIKQDMPAESRTSATFFVQDILLAATFFIGTIITIALLRSGVMYILAWATNKDPSNAKNGIKYSIIWLLLVISSYAIIRLVQYIAKGF